MDNSRYCAKCGCEVFRFTETENGELDNKDIKKWFFNPTGEGYLCIDCYRETEKAKEIQKELMEKHGFTNWKYISIATKNVETRCRLIGLGFKEPIKRSIRLAGGCWNLYYSTQSQKEFINMQNIVNSENLDIVGIELNAMATADYIGYLEGISDPRD